MIKNIGTKTYRTHTAHWLLTVSCPFPSHDPKWHDTQIYRTQRGGYFMAGNGGSRSCWAKQTPNGAVPGEGIEVLTKEEAHAYAVRHGVSSDRLARMGFERPVIS